MINTQKWETELQIKVPWKIDDISFKQVTDQEEKKDKEQNALHVSLSYKRGSYFLDETETPCPVYDTYKKIWRHLDYDNHHCYVHCKVPRIQTTEGNVKLINVPWARQDSRFTLCFEAHIVQLISKNQPLTSICTQLNETLDRILVVFNHWVNTAYSFQIIDQTMDAIGIDELSNSTNDRQITTLIDLRNHRVLSVIEGKNQETTQQIKTYLETKGINTSQIKHVSGNLFNHTFLTQLESCFPNATLCFDRLYVTKQLNDAMDQISSTERKNIKKLTKHRTLFRTDPTHLTAEQKILLLQLTADFPRIEKAYRLKILFNNLWEQKSTQEANVFLDSWCQSVEESSLTPFKEFAKMIQKHKNSIINSTKLPTKTTTMETIHEKTRQIKNRKSGLRNIENFSNMVYLLCGKLSFPEFPEYTNTPK